MAKLQLTPEQQALKDLIEQNQKMLKELIKKEKEEKKSTGDIRYAPIRNYFIDLLITDSETTEILNNLVKKEGEITVRFKNTEKDGIKVSVHLKALPVEKHEIEA